MHQQQLMITVTSTFTAEPLHESLVFWARELHIPMQCQFAPYNQVFQQLLDPQSMLARNQQGVNIVLVRLEDWHYPTRVGIPHSANDQHRELGHHVTEFISAIQTAVARSSSIYLICVCPAAPQIMDNPSRHAQFTALERQIANALHPLSGVHVVSSDKLQQTYPVARYYRPNGDQLGGIPFTAPWYTALGTLIIRTLISLRHPPYKVVVLDCDHTLWDGVCGEDALADLSISTPYRVLQELMIMQHQSGMLLCVCSKNHAADVDAVFAHHPDMVLRRDHVVGWRVNWQRKSDNIRSLAAELRLGLDSFIFIDNDVLECAEVRSACPDVLTLQLPTEPAAIPVFLKHIWAFDQTKVTTEDQLRATFYLQNIQREQLCNESVTFATFLENLRLQVTIRALAPADSVRVAQLTQRTNQFNTTTIRRSEEAIYELYCPDRPVCYVVHVCDRFGDYGLVGAIMVNRTDDTLIVESFLLSCRALGRGVEYQMLAELGHMAQTEHLDTIVVPYVYTRKNQPVLDFLHHAGASVRPSTEEGVDFIFSAAVAATVCFTPTSSLPSSFDHVLPDQGSSAATAPHDQSRISWAQMQQIATELTDAKTIWRRICDAKLSQVARDQQATT